MDVDITTVRHIAKLARIALSEEETFYMKRELDKMKHFVKILDEVDVTDIEPIISITHIPTNIPLRDDYIADGNKAHDIVANAPLTKEDFFLVPKVIESIL